MLGKDIAMTFCTVCGEFSGSVIEVRKHMFKEHYDHVLLQMGGDKQKLQQWMKLKE